MDDKELTVQRWLIKAERDIKTAKTMLDSPDAPTDIVCFHSQQCAEKALKAFLVYSEIDYPKTHDLQKLLGLCSEKAAGFASLEEDAMHLSDYAVEPRYVDEWRDISADEAISAIQKAAQIFSFVKTMLRMPGNDQ